MPGKSTRKSAHRRVVVGKTTAAKKSAPSGRPTPARRTPAPAKSVVPNARPDPGGKRDAPGAGGRLQTLFIFGIVFACLLLAVYALVRPDSTGATRVLALPEGIAGLPIFPTRTPTVVPSPTPLPPPQVAIVAGHWSGENPPEGVVPDVGAVCDDGLREVDVNRAVADRAAAILRGQGYRVQVLQEFDTRLKRDAPDYKPDVFLAVHSDSCVHGADYPLATGYKIAHAEPSDIPEQDDRLVACLRREYDAVVQPFNLTFNANTVTRDMTEYHGFREIVNTTPAAIIELGFLYNDRAVLTGHQDALAKGISKGLMAFLMGDRCGMP